MRIRTLSFLVGTLALGLAAGPTAGQNAEQQHAAGQQAPGMMSMHGAAMQGAMQRMQQGMDMPSSGAMNAGRKIKSAALAPAQPCQCD